MNENCEKLIVKNNITLLDFISLNKQDLSKKKIKQYIKYNMVEVNNKVVTNSNYNVFIII